MRASCCAICASRQRRGGGGSKFQRPSLPPRGSASKKKERGPPNQFSLLFFSFLFLSPFSFFPFFFFLLPLILFDGAFFPYPPFPPRKRDKKKPNDGVKMGVLLVLFRASLPPRCRSYYFFFLMALSWEPHSPPSFFFI